MIAILIKSKEEWKRALDYLFNKGFTWKSKLFGAYNDFLFDELGTNYLKLENKTILYNSFADASKDIIFNSLENLQEDEYNIIS